MIVDQRLHSQGTSSWQLTDLTCGTSAAPASDMITAQHSHVQRVTATDCLLSGRITKRSGPHTFRRVVTEVPQLEDRTVFVRRATGSKVMRAAIATVMFVAAIGAAGVRIAHASSMQVQAAGSTR